jgi:hypothetical protein
MKLVVDASVAVKWFVDEAGADRALGVNGGAPPPSPRSGEGGPEGRMGCGKQVRVVEDSR